MYTCMHVCMCTCMRVCMLACKVACTHAYIHTYKYAWTQGCIHTHTHTFMHVSAVTRMAHLDRTCGRSRCTPSERGRTCQGRRSVWHDGFIDYDRFRMQRPDQKRAAGAAFCQKRGVGIKPQPCVVQINRLSNGLAMMMSARPRVG